MNLEAAVCRHCGADVPEGADRCLICERVVRRPWLAEWTLPGLALGLGGLALALGLIAPPVGLGLGAVAVLAAGVGMSGQSRLRRPALAVTALILVGLGVWWHWAVSDLQAIVWQAQLFLRLQQLLGSVFER